MFLQFHCRKRTKNSATCIQILYKHCCEIKHFRPPQSPQKTCGILEGLAIINLPNYIIILKPKTYWKSNFLALVKCPQLGFLLVLLYPNIFIIFQSYELPPILLTHTHTHHNISLILLFKSIRWSFFPLPCLCLHHNFVCLHLTTSVYLCCSLSVFIFSYLSPYLAIVLANPLNRCLDPSLSNIHPSSLLFLSFYFFRPPPLLMFLLCLLIGFLSFQQVSSSLNHLSSSRFGLSSVFPSANISVSHPSSVWVSPTIFLSHSSLSVVIRILWQLDDRYHISDCNLMHLYRWACYCC